MASARRDYVRLETVVTLDSPVVEQPTGVCIFVAKHRRGASAR
jgi:hypothetical protein